MSQRSREPLTAQAHPAPAETNRAAPRTLDLGGAGPAGPPPESATGLPIGNRFVGTPRAGVRTSEYGRDYRMGYGMQVLEQGKLNLELGIDAERRESPLFLMQAECGGTERRV